jgi:hypothetical protein
MEDSWPYPALQDAVVVVKREPREELPCFLKEVVPYRRISSAHIDRYFTNMHIVGQKY